MSWYMAVLKKYAEFNGRARRQEFWMFVLINFAIAVVLNIIGMVIGTSILGTLFMLATLLPGIGVTIRRLHDTNRTGWLTLLLFINIIFLVQEGTRGPNQYGPDPKMGG